MLSRGAPPSNRLQHVRASEGAELSPSEAAASTLLSQRRRGPMAFATKAPLLLMANQTQRDGAGSYCLQTFAKDCQGFLAG